MYIKPNRGSRRAFSLAEAMVAMGIFGLLSIGLCSIYLFSLRGFTALANYAELDQINRGAMDKLTREIREAKKVTKIKQDSTGTNIIELTLVNNIEHAITYKFDSEKRIFTRTDADAANPVPETILTNCAMLHFVARQRTAKDGTFATYELSQDMDSIQVIQLTWSARRSIGGTSITNSENIQTANVVIRNQRYASDSNVNFGQ